MTDEEFAVWLYNPELSPDVRNEACFKVLTEAQQEGLKTEHNLERIGKAACHLLYRSMEGENVDMSKAMPLAHWARNIAANGEHACPLFSSRWFGSISMALVYHMILIEKDFGTAGELCLRMNDNDTAIKAHAQNALNIIRANVITAAMMFMAGDYTRMQMATHIAKWAFKKGITELRLVDSTESLANELHYWVSALNIAMMLEPLKLHNSWDRSVRLTQLANHVYRPFTAALHAIATRC